MIARLKFTWAWLKILIGGVAKTLIDRRLKMIDRAWLSREWAGFRGANGKEGWVGVAGGGVACRGRGRGQSESPDSAFSSSFFPRGTGPAPRGRRPLVFWGAAPPASVASRASLIIRNISKRCRPRTCR